MAGSELNVYNLALTMLGSEGSVQSLNEESREAEQCGLWYETTRDLVFSAAPWNSLTGYARLATAAHRDPDEAWVATDPPPGWLHSYALPADCLRPRYLSSYAPFVPTVLQNNLRVIATNEETPILIYTVRQTRVDLWGVDLIMAVAHALAAHMAKAITGKDSDLQNMWQLADERVRIARANFANEQQYALESNPEWITARGFGLAAPTSRYLYPNAAFIPMGFTGLG